MTRAGGGRAVRLAPAGGAGRLHTTAAANFWRAWWAWLICFVMTVLVSLFTRKKPRSELEGLVRGLTAGGPEERVPFVRTVEFYGLLSLVVFLTLNIYFW